MPTGNSTFAASFATPQLYCTVGRPGGGLGPVVEVILRLQGIPTTTFAATPFRFVGSRKLEECQRIATLLQAIGNDVILLSSESLAGDDTGTSSEMNLAEAYASVAEAIADKIVEHIKRERCSV